MHFIKIEYAIWIVIQETHIPGFRFAEPTPLAQSSESASLGCVQVEPLPVEVSLRDEAELKGGIDRLEGEGEGGLFTIQTSRRGSEWALDSGAPDILRFGLYFGGSL